MKLDVRDLAFAGGSAGLVLFMMFGLMPSMAYGADAGISLARGVFGSTSNVIIVTMMLAVISLFMIAGVFTAVGASVAAGLGAIRKALKRKV